jgi:hypothetical protein
MPDRFEQSASRGSSGARIDPDPSAAAGGRDRLDRLGRRHADRRRVARPEEGAAQPDERGAPEQREDPE